MDLRARPRFLSTQTQVQALRNQRIEYVRAFVMGHVTCWSIPRFIWAREPWMIRSNKSTEKRSVIRPSHSGGSLSHAVKLLSMY